MRQSLKNLRRAAKRYKETVPFLADEIFSLVERYQGYAFISDGLGVLTKEKLFMGVKGALRHTEKTARIMRKWLKKYDQL